QVDEREGTIVICCSCHQREKPLTYRVRAVARNVLIHPPAAKGAHVDFQQLSKFSLLVARSCLSDQFDGRNLCVHQASNRWEYLRSYCAQFVPEDKGQPVSPI